MNTYRIVTNGGAPIMETMFSDVISIVLPILRASIRKTLTVERLADDDTDTYVASDDWNVVP